jgi:uncharacterized protein (DUF1684 family)
MIMSAASNSAPADEHRAWQARRLHDVASATGNLALVETRWLPERTTEEARSALVDQLRADAAEGVTVTTLSRTSLETGAPEFGIRVWNAASPAIVAFDTIDVFPFDPEWVIEADFVPADPGRTVPFEHIRDNGSSRELVVPGDIRFRLNGIDYELSAFDDAGTLLLVFGDETNRATDETRSYSSGRFLFVSRIDKGGFGEPGRVLLDFNRAFIPPCGFSVQYNCPLPPAQNRFAFPVVAGERLVQFHNNFDIYGLSGD